MTFQGLCQAFVLKAQIVAFDFYVLEVAEI